jgi:NADH-quinone oxidoreductase subunit C
MLRTISEVSPESTGTTEQVESSTIINLVQQKYPAAVLNTHQHRGDETIMLKREFIQPICRLLRDHSDCRFEMFVDLTAVDYLLVKIDLQQIERFEVVYHLHSLSKGHRIRLKCPVPEDDCQIPSIHMLWDAVNWYERECYDMYGIHFEGHPNLTRILMYEQFQGHPLRKDYPVDKQQPLLELNDIEERHHYGRFE